MVVLITWALVAVSSNPTSGVPTSSPPFVEPLRGERRWPIHGAVRAARWLTATVSHENVSPAPYWPRPTSVSRPRAVPVTGLLLGHSTTRWPTHSWFSGTVEGRGDGEDSDRTQSLKSFKFVGQNCDRTDHP
jgi:hypothetical protein